MKNDFRAPKTLGIRSTAVDVVFKPDVRRDWASQKNVPTQIKMNRMVDKAKAKIREAVEGVRTRTASPVVDTAFVRKTKLGYKVLGFARHENNTEIEYFPTFESTFEAARLMGRKYIKMGAVLARVPLAQN